MKIDFKMLKYSLSIVACFFLVSCDLEFQKKNEFIPGALPPPITFENQTAWEWMQTQTSPTGVTPQANKLDFMLQLIKIAGLEAEYQKTDSKRTYLFLNNAAFTGTGRINALLTGVANGTGDLSKVNKDRAANLLKYHIVEAYVDQVNALPIYTNFYEFNTALGGANGVIGFKRDERYFLSINSSPNLPSTKRTTTVTLHNYRFKNSIAHFISSHVSITNF
jgi:hypothetical protein